MKFVGMSWWLALLGSVTMASAPASAQQTTGTVGLPSATTTIDGRQIPAPEPKFGGVIEETLKGSKTWWPPRIVPPKGAPNILLIMTDDQGYGVIWPAVALHAILAVWCLSCLRPDSIAQWFASQSYRRLSIAILKCITYDGSNVFR
jgi:hypothetical protein